MTATGLRKKTSPLVLVSENRREGRVYIKKPQRRQQAKEPELRERTNRTGH